MKLSVQVACACRVGGGQANELSLQGRKVVQFFGTDFTCGFGSTHALKMKTDLLNFGKTCRIEKRHINGSGCLHFQDLFADKPKNGLAYWGAGHTHRSEERRVGKACVSRCRYRWATYY